MWLDHDMLYIRVFCPFSELRKFKNEEMDKESSLIEQEGKIGEKSLVMWFMIPIHLLSTLCPLPANVALLCWTHYVVWNIKHIHLKQYFDFL